MPGVVYFAMESLINLRYTLHTRITLHNGRSIFEKPIFSREQPLVHSVSRPHETADKIMLCTIVWKFLESAGKERTKYLTEWYQAFSDFVCEVNYKFLLSFLNVSTVNNFDGIVKYKFITIFPWIMVMEREPNIFVTLFILESRPSSALTPNTADGFYIFVQ